MDLTAAITHFDGDPLLISYWLKVYEKYWRGQVDKVYASIAYNPELVTPEVVIFLEAQFNHYPEIKTFWFKGSRTPEDMNAWLIKQSTEPYLFLIESDGLVFDNNMVAMFLGQLKNNEFDIVAGKHPLITHKYYADRGWTGLMRNCLFIKRELLDKIDVDFNPKTIPINGPLPFTSATTKEPIDLDCFGWICMQLFGLEPKINFIESGCLHPDTYLDPKTYVNKHWLHIRQMSSSSLGLGKDGEFSVWAGKDKNKFRGIVFRNFSEGFADGAGEFTYLKSCAFKLMFYDAFEDKASIADYCRQYHFVFNSVIDWLGLSREKIAEIKGFYRGLIQV